MGETLLELYHKYLLAQGIPRTSIIHINFEDFTYRFIDTVAKLYEHIIPLQAKENRLNTPHEKKNLNDIKSHLVKAVFPFLLIFCYA
ncbi:MAG: hypothetical protein ACQ5SW_04865 [Sphaerochaetaceae bacterium]